MKTLLCLIILCAMPFCYAGKPSYIQLKITSTAKDNRYFLCLSEVGCLSLKAGMQGRPFKLVDEVVEMSNIYLTDVSSGFRVSPQGLPHSCRVTINEKQTLTIYGKVVRGLNETLLIKDLKCKLTG